MQLMPRNLNKLRTNMLRPLPMLALAAIMLLQLTNLGCTSVRVTDPARTATEQFLLSEAAQRAVTKLSVTALRGRLLYVDGTYFAGSEKDFVMGQVRSHLVQNGARLTNVLSEAEIIVEVRSGGVGIDRYGYLLGIPPILVPESATGAGGLPESIPIVAPELAILKNIRQYGVASVAFVAYWHDTGELVAASGPFIGNSYREDWWFFGIGPRTTGDIPPVDAPEAASARARELRAEVEAESRRREQAAAQGEGDSKTGDGDGEGTSDGDASDSPRTLPTNRASKPVVEDPDLPED